MPANACRSTMCGWASRRSNRRASTLVSRRSRRPARASKRSPTPCEQALIVRVNMHIGVPKEIKVLENRVGLTPASVPELVHRGHTVTVERDAGQGIGVVDADYRREGALIAATAAEVFARCDMIVKVKEPQAAERAMLRAGQVLFTYLHLAPDPDQTRDLVASDAVC